MEWITEIHEFWQYVILFLLAVAPWIDIFIVVPLGIALGLNAVMVSIIGFTGNFLMVLLLGLFFRQLAAWRERRRAGKGITAPTRRETRARIIWERYGLPVLALTAPVILGADLAALLALTFGSSRKMVLLWMAVSLALWTVVMAVGSVYGLGYLEWIKK